jgi:hypothetical protein
MMERVCGEVQRFGKESKWVEKYIVLKNINNGSKLEVLLIFWAPISSSAI